MRLGAVSIAAHAPSVAIAISFVRTFPSRKIRTATVTLWTWIIVRAVGSVFRNAPVGP